MLWEGPQKLKNQTQGMVPQAPHPALTQAAHSRAGYDAQLQAGQPTQVVHHQHHRGSCRVGDRMRPLPAWSRVCAEGQGGLTRTQRQVGGVGGVRHVCQHRFHCLICWQHLGAQWGHEGGAGGGGNGRCGGGNSGSLLTFILRTPASPWIPEEVRQQ